MAKRDLREYGGVHLVDTQLHRAPVANELTTDHRELELFRSSQGEGHEALNADVLRADFGVHKLVRSAEDRLRDALVAAALMIDSSEQ